MVSISNLGHTELWLPGRREFKFTRSLTVSSAGLCVNVIAIAVGSGSLMKENYSVGSLMIVPPDLG